MLIFPTDLPAQIFSCHNAIISVTKVLFHVIDLKLDIEPSLTVLLSRISGIFPRCKQLKLYKSEVSRNITRITFDRVVQKKLRWYSFMFIVVILRNRRCRLPCVYGA